MGKTLAEPYQTVRRQPSPSSWRVYEYDGDDRCATGGKITGEFLVVKGLHGYEDIDERVDVEATPNPNVIP